MSHAAYRIRKRVKAWQSTIDLLLNEAKVKGDSDGEAVYVAYWNAAENVLNIIDEETEREAEKQFTRPILPQGSYLSGGDGPE